MFHVVEVKWAEVGYSGQLKIAHACSDSTAVNHSAAVGATPIAISTDKKSGGSRLSSELNTSFLQSPVAVVL